MNPLVVIIVNFIVGIACIIFGVNFMSSNLQKINGRIMRKVITRFTGNTYTAFATGTIATALVQSSTAITVMTVGLVNSGFLKLSQAVGIVYGSNIGTTLTAQLMSFRITDYSIPFIAFGILVKYVSRRISVKHIGLAITGFGCLFLGLSILNSGVPYIQQSPVVFDMFKKHGTNPYIGLAVGLITTMLVQSSNATVGITIVLFNSGFISLDTAIGLTLGDNIGTCVSAQLASLGTNIAARRTAWAHTLYNILGVAMAIILLSPFSVLIINLTKLLGQDSSRLIANTHTIFNVLSAVIFLPLTKYYVKFIEHLVKK